MYKNHMTCHFNNQKQLHPIFTILIQRGTLVRLLVEEEIFHIQILQLPKTLKETLITLKMILKIHKMVFQFWLKILLLTHMRILKLLKK